LQDLVQGDGKGINLFSIPFEGLLFLNYIGNVSIKQNLFGKIESKRQIASEGINVK
jgi:hypothetical protein